jgi:hypothetical protein
MVRVALVQYGDWTALHRAASSGHVDAVKALLAAGANVTATDVRATTWRRALCWWQALELLGCLLPVSGEVAWSHGVKLVIAGVDAYGLRGGGTG